MNYLKHVYVCGVCDNDECMLILRSQICEEHLPDECPWSMDAEWKEITNPATLLDSREEEE